MIPILHSLGLMIPGQLGLGDMNNDLIYSNHSGFILGSQGVLDSDHVLLGNSVGDHDHQWDFSFHCLDHGVGREGWGNVNDTCVTSGFFSGFSAVLEDWQSKMLGSSL